MIDSTKKASSYKPAKPYPDFPLFAHATKRWAKKIRGKLFYFGSWDDPNAALEKFLNERDDLFAGRTPRISNGALTVRDLVNRFLTAKQHQLDTGEIINRTFRDYYDTCNRIITVIGKTRSVDDLASDDFEGLRTQISKTRGLVSLGNEVQRIRAVFKYAYDANLIEKPMRFGPTFKRPSKKTLRKVRHAKGKRMFEASELRQLLKKSDVHLRAMIYLGINCGFGNHDCGTLPLSALDLTNGWVEFPRPKTGIHRRCPLWSETIYAIKQSLARRPKHNDHKDNNLVFITKYGKPWAKDTPDSPITKEMTKLLKAHSMHRPGLGFYALRHTFETIGGDSRDQVAVDFIMGHSPAADDMASRYRESISDERLTQVITHIRSWLFSKKLGGNIASKSKQ